MKEGWNMNTQIIVGGVIVLVLLIAAWWLFTKPTPTGVDMMPDNGSQTSTTTQQQGSGTSTSQPTVEVNTGEDITAEDQPAGDSVRVMEAKLSRVTWLAVRDPLRIYGAAKVTPPQGGGTVQDITIPLLRNTESGTSYTIVAYVDDGDGAFDFKKDSLVSGLEDTFTALQGD
jgi:hypothetical protein